MCLPEYFGGVHGRVECSLLIIHGCISGIRTTGETPKAAMAGTASCIAASECVIDPFYIIREETKLSYHQYCHARNLPTPNLPLIVPRF